MTPRFSIITCSIDAKKYKAFTRSARRVFGDRVQLILIDDARSLSEGYQRGAALALADLLIFCHDDIQFIEPNMPQFLAEDLASYHLVGVAGASKLVTGNWVAAGFPYLHGQIIHKKPDVPGFIHYQYSNGADATITEGIQALDGVFLACRRELLEQVSFDADRFDGFHLYDLDFCFAAHLAGFRLIVDQRLRLVHYSGGNYNQQWRKYASRFDRKYKHQLATPTHPLSYYRSTTYDTLAAAETATAAVLQATRMRCQDKIWQVSIGGQSWRPADASIGGEAAFISAPETVDPQELLAKAGPDALIALQTKHPPEASWRRLGPYLPGFRPVAASPGNGGQGFLLLLREATGG